MKNLSVKYPVWFCDVWGVVHNGVAPYEAAGRCLSRHREAGGTVILVTNSPRTSTGVAKQLTQIGVPAEAYDAIVTSGDVTQTLMHDHARGKVFHVGPGRDLSIFAGGGVERVALEEANAVLCTGLVHDDVETPDDYKEQLARFKQMGLPMICANPDKIVRNGNRLLYCAGALAERYADIGGTVLMAGKPYAPIYELALKTAARIRGAQVEKSQVLAIGDGPETDIRGAADFGFDALLIADGVLDASAGLDAVQAHVQKLVPHARIVKTLPYLAW